MLITPGRSAYRSAVRRGARTMVVHTEFLADLLTPVSAYLALSAGTDNSFLLESVDSGKFVGRYSFIGIEPKQTFTAYGDRIIIDKAGVITTRRGNPTGSGANPWVELEKMVRKEKIEVSSEVISPFLGGAVGYIGYETVGLIEDKLRKLSKVPSAVGAPACRQARRPCRVPDFSFMFTDTLVIFDNFKRKIVIATIIRRPREVSDYDAAVEKIRRIKDKLLSGSVHQSTGKITGQNRPGSGFTSNFKKRDFEKAVAAAKQYIYEGDIFQVVISQRFERQTAVKPFDIYRVLRVLNPSPYMFYYNTPQLKLIGSSPEILVTVTGGKARLRPIAGTRPRGRTDAEDRAYETELLTDPKERAEHIMLVDLGRNDLGRVCSQVRVDDLMVVEKYSHVMHIVSNVTGKIKPGRNAFDVLKATFPAGTVSGAPKIRAMEIIHELEPGRRNTYAGAMGYFSYTGDLDMCITIRTILYKDGRVSIQAGAGIVADSVPEREYQESVNKARALFRAVEIATGGLE